MDLIDLIGDSRTDSLPAGFLRSIKIKYRQEKSNVFPNVEKSETQHSLERAKTAETDKSTPSFMEWKVPSRLVTKRPQAPIPQTPDSGILSRQDVCSRMSRMTLKSGEKQEASPLREQLPRLGSVKSSRGSALSKIKPSLPKIQENVSTRKEIEQPLSRENLSGSAQGRRVLNKILSEAEKGNAKPSNSALVEAVDKWLKTASEKEREVALKFFSTLAGSKTEFMNVPLQKYHTHTDGDCDKCDGDRINETLETLAKRDKLPTRLTKRVSLREPNIGNASFYQRTRLPSRVKRSFQTWHHLPVYTYNDGVPNKSSMFTQPHKFMGRHFSIHPEWGLHTGLKKTSV